MSTFGHRYFLRKLRKVKKANGQIIAINEVGLPIASQALASAMPQLVIRCCRTPLEIPNRDSTTPWSVDDQRWLQSRTTTTCLQRCGCRACMCLQCCGLRSSQQKRRDLLNRHTGIAPPRAPIASQCRVADLREESDDGKELRHLGEVHVADGLPQHVQGVSRRHPQWRCGAGAARSLYISAGWHQQPFLENYRPLVVTISVCTHCIDTLHCNCT